MARQTVSPMFSRRLAAEIGVRTLLACCFTVSLAVLVSGAERFGALVFCGFILGVTVPFVVQGIERGLSGGDE